MSQPRSFKRTVLVAAICIALAIPGSGAYAAENWDFQVIPYLWAAGISMDAKINDRETGADLSFSDLLDKTDVAFALHFEAGKDKAGFLFDFFGIKGSDEMSLNLPVGPGLSEGVLASEVEARVIEGGGYYRPGGRDGNFDIILGLRYIDLDQDLDATHPLPLPPPFPPELSTSQEFSASFTDVFVGARFHSTLGERWTVAVRGDVGGGDSDLSWSAYGSFAYGFGRDGKYQLRLGYKHFAMEGSTKNGPLTLESDVSFSGPITGFEFRF